MISRPFLRACLLLLLDEQPGYGYEVRARLVTRFGWDGGDPSRAYRTLRAMEREGLLASAWRDPKLGPHTRHYSVTAAGREALEVLATEVRQTRSVLGAGLTATRRKS